MSEISHAGRAGCHYVAHCGRRERTHREQIYYTYQILQIQFTSYMTLPRFKEATVYTSVFVCNIFYEYDNFLGFTQLHFDLSLIYAWILKRNLYLHSLSQVVVFGSRLSMKIGHLSCSLSCVWVYGTNNQLYLFFFLSDFVNHRCIYNNSTIFNHLCTTN